MAVISVFVASTFRDFHQERDLLRGRIARRLSDEVAASGCRVEFVDLRWGATDAGLAEDERETQILTICAREIDRSRPLIIGLLGSSYGNPFRGDHLPDAELDRLPPEVRQRIGSISVTEYELLYAMNSSAPTDIVVFSRQVAGKVVKEWLENSDAAADLRRRLRDSDRVTLRPYRASIAGGVLDLEAFEREVVKALLPRVRRRAAEIESGDPYADAERLLLTQHAEPVGFEPLTTEIDSRLRDGRTVILASPQVVGKTALFAAAVKALRESGDKVATVSVGVGPVHTLGGIVAALLRQLAPGAGPESFEEYAAAFAWFIDGNDPDEPVGSVTSNQRATRRRSRAVWLGTSIVRYALHSGYRCVAVDGIDRLSGSHEDRALAWEMFDQVQDAEGVGLLLTTDKERRASESDLIEIPPLSPESAVGMLERLVRRSGRVGVPAEVAKHVASTERSPLWVSTVFDVINGLEGSELAVGPVDDWAVEIERVLADAVRSLPDDDEGAVLGAIERIAQADGPLSTGITRRFVDVVALAPGALTARVLGEVLEADASTVSSTRYRLGGLIEESGRDRSVRVRHPSVGRMIVARIAPDAAHGINARIAHALLESAGTRSEAVALFRHALLARDAALAARASDRVVEILGRLGFTPQSMGVDLSGVYREAAIDRGILLDIDRVGSDALAVLGDVVLRRLDNGASVEPSEDEWPFLDALLDRVEREDIAGGAIPRETVVELHDEIAMRYSRLAPRKKDLHGSSERYWRTLGAAKRELADADVADLGAVAKFGGRLLKVVTGAYGYVDPARRDLLVDEFVAVQDRLEGLVGPAMASADEQERLWLEYVILEQEFNCGLLVRVLARSDPDAAVARANALLERCDALATSFGLDDEERVERVRAWASQRILDGMANAAGRTDRLPESRRFF